MVIFRYLLGIGISMSSAFAVNGVISARGALVAQWWGFQLVWLDKLYSCRISIHAYVTLQNLPFVSVSLNSPAGTQRKPSSNLLSFVGVKQI